MRNIQLKIIVYFEEFEYSQITSDSLEGHSASKSVENKCQIPMKVMSKTSSTKNLLFQFFNGRGKSLASVGFITKRDYSIFPFILPFMGLDRGSLGPRFIIRIVLRFV